MPGDSENVFLHWNHVLAPAKLACSSITIVVGQFELMKAQCLEIEVDPFKLMQGHLDLFAEMRS